MAQRYKMPTPQAALVDQRLGGPSPVYYRYLAGIDELSSRVSINISNLGASPTNAEIATAFNALLAALQNANLQETS